MQGQIKYCPRCKTPAELSTPMCSQCGRQFRTQFPQPTDDRTLVGDTPAPFTPEGAGGYPGQYPAEQYAPPYPADPYAQPQYGVPTTHQSVIIQQQLPPQPQVVVIQAGSRNDILAVMSLVMGILSWLFFCFGGPIFGGVGVFLGVFSLFRQRRNPDLEGQGLAIGGIMLSAIPFAFGVFPLLVLLVGAASSGPK